MPAILRAVEIDTTDIFFLPGQLPQPRTSEHLFAGCRANPDFSAARVVENFWSVIFPPVYFARRHGQTAVAINRATLTALITVFHNIV